MLTFEIYNIGTKLPSMFNTRFIVLFVLLNNFGVLINTYIKTVKSVHIFTSYTIIFIS